MNKEQQEGFNTVIDHMLKLSDRAMDNRLFPRLAALKDRGNECRYELLGIIQDTQYFALSSDFIVTVMYGLWGMAGGTKSELSEISKEIERPKTREEYQILHDKFKWCWDCSEQMNII